MKKMVAICALTLFAIGLNVNAAILQLDFDVSLTGECTTLCFNYSDPIQSSYRMTIDTTGLETTSITNAFNDRTSYYDTLTTRVYVSSPDEYRELNYTQTYRVGPDSDTQMTNQIYMYDYARTIDRSNLEYTGTLPTGYEPDLAGNAFIQNDQYIDFSFTEQIGTMPLYSLYTEDNIDELFISMIGREFNYNSGLSSALCIGSDEAPEACLEQLSYNYTSGYGTATLASVSTVPVPAAIWLFGSGLLGLVGVARRKVK